MCAWRRNLKNADGSRAIGTILDPSGPVIAAINKGEPYYGEARVLGKPYDAGYEPIRDVANNVIGVYFVGYASSVTARKEPARGRRSATRRSLVEARSYSAASTPCGISSNVKAIGVHHLVPGRHEVLHELVL